MLQTSNFALWTECVINLTVLSFGQVSFKAIIKKKNELTNHLENQCTIKTAEKVNENELHTIGLPIILFEGGMGLIRGSQFRYLFLDPLGNCQNEQNVA